MAPKVPRETPPLKGPPTGLALPPAPKPLAPRSGTNTPVPESATQPPSRPASGLALPPAPKKPTLPPLPKMASPLLALRSTPQPPPQPTVEVDPEPAPDTTPGPAFGFTYPHPSDFTYPPAPPQYIFQHHHPAVFQAPAFQVAPQPTPAAASDPDIRFSIPPKLCHANELGPSFHQAISVAKTALNIAETTRNSLYPEKASWKTYATAGCIRSALRGLSNRHPLGSIEGACRYCFDEQILCIRNSKQHGFYAVPLPERLRQGVGSADLIYFVSGMAKASLEAEKTVGKVWHSGWEGVH